MWLGEGACRSQGMGSRAAMALAPGSSSSESSGTCISRVVKVAGGGIAARGEEMGGEEVGCRGFYAS